MNKRSRKSKIQNIQNLKWLALGAMLFAVSFPAEAQQAVIPRTGVIV